MAEITEIQLYTSNCTRNDYYLDLIKDVMKSLMLDCRMEKIIGMEKISQHGFYDGCMNAYCPGCKAMQKYRDPSVRYLPVLAINGQAAMHGQIPTTGGASTNCTPIYTESPFLHLEPLGIKAGTSYCGRLFLCVDQMGQTLRQMQKSSSSPLFLLFLLCLTKVRRETTLLSQTDDKGVLHRRLVFGVPHQRKTPNGTLGHTIATSETVFLVHNSYIVLHCQRSYLTMLDTLATTDATFFIYGRHKI